MSRDEILAVAQSSGFQSPLIGILKQVMSQSSEDHSAEFWHVLIHQSLMQLVQWRSAIGSMFQNATINHLCGALTELCNRTPILAPVPSRIFRAYSEIDPARASVVFVGQDPYPSADKTRATLDVINRMPHAKVAEMLGDEYAQWSLVMGTPWPDYEVHDECRPRVRIGAVPYACGKSFAYPSVCTQAPGSYENMRDAVKASGYAHPKMDPELNEWSRQGVLMLNACPVLYDGSSKNPNVWTAFTAEILTSIAICSPYAVFILLGNSAKFYKKSILEARSTACIVETGHPSKRSSSSGSFIASNVFSGVNAFRAAISQTGNVTLPQIKW